MKYDDASWHMGDAKSEAHAGAHIGLYFRWCLAADLVSEEHTEEEELVQELDRVRKGELSATEYLWENTSGKLADVDLTDDGDLFTRWFYSKRYLNLLLESVGKDAYAFTEDEVDFSRLRLHLDEAFRKWKASPPKRLWWKLW